MRRISINEPRASKRRLVAWMAAVGLLMATASNALAEGCEDSPPDFWERSTALGSFGEARNDLCRKGIELGGTHIAEFLDNPVGGLRQGGKYQGRTEFDLDIDAEKLAGVTGLTAHASAFWIQGGRLSGKNIGNTMPVSNIEAVPGLRLYTLWMQQSLWDDAVNLRAGQLAADDEFAASAVSALFINGTFGWPTMISANVPSGGPAYPLAAPGVRLKLGADDRLSWKTAVFAADPGGRPNGHDAQYRDKDGTLFSLSRGTFIITEAAYSINQGKDDGGLAGTYKLGGWYNGQRFADLRWDEAGLSLADPATTGTSKPLRGNWGIYGIIDQMLLREQAGSDQGLSAFLRVGAGPADRSPVAYYADAGLAYKGLLASRAEDTLGFAIAYAPVSDNLRALDRDTRTLGGQAAYPVRDHEMVFELSYQAILTPWWTVQPDIQYILHPGGSIPNAGSATGLTPIEDALVLGVRTTVKF